MGSDRRTLESLLETIRAIGQEGLGYADNDYDVIRYTKLLDVAALHYADITGVDAAQIKKEFLQTRGIVTPKVGVDAAIMNDDGAVLVLRRSDDGAWGMPGGWMDIGESPFETAQRETLEESGLRIKPIGYIAIAHKTPLTHPGFASQVNICVAAGKVPTDSAITLSHEHTAYKWVHGIDQIDNWHVGQKRFFPRIFAAYREENFIPDI